MARPEPSVGDLLPLLQRLTHADLIHPLLFERPRFDRSIDV
jgi:hypothetical protein